MRPSCKYLRFPIRPIDLALLPKAAPIRGSGSLVPINLMIQGFSVRFSIALRDPQTAQNRDGLPQNRNGGRLFASLSDTRKISKFDKRRRPFGSSSPTALAVFGTQSPLWLNALPIAFMRSELIPTR